MEEKIIEILNEIKSGVDYKNEKGIVDNGVLHSFDIITLVRKLSDEFDVEITAAELLPENFNSVEAIAEMIEDLED